MKTELKNIQENYPNITLRKFCETTGLCYQYLLKLSKQPIANQPYDPTAFNYEAVQKVIDKREGLDLDSFNWSEIEAQAVATRNIQRNSTTLKREEFVLADGSTAKVHFTLRSNPNTYFTIYTNDTNIVFGDVNSDDVRTMNWNTFLHQSPRIILPTNPENVATSVDTLASDPGSQQKAKTKKRSKKEAQND